MPSILGVEGWTASTLSWMQAVMAEVVACRQPPDRRGVPIEAASGTSARHSISMYGHRGYVISPAHNPGFTVDLLFLGMNQGTTGRKATFDFWRFS